MAGDPGQLHHQHSNRLRPRRNLDADQLLDRHHEADVVDRGRQVIHPIAKGDALRIGLVLEGFLESSVEVADIGIRIAHNFAVELQPNPQYAVRAGVLRTHVELHPFRFRLVLRAECFLGDAGFRLSHGWHRAPALRVSGR